MPANWQTTMANSPEARALTEQHRREQITFGIEAEVEARIEWNRLNPDSLDATTPGWLTAASAGIVWRRRQSAATATGYVVAYREAEVDGAGPIARDVDARRIVEGTLMLAGPIAIKRAIASGMDRHLAWAQAGRDIAQQAPKLVMNGGRSVVTRSSRANRSRWRRVTDGDPCAFCAMLAGRGPVYSAETVTFPLHKGRCGCTAEEVFGHWEPNALEAKWDDSYIEASRILKAKHGPMYGLNDRDVTFVMRRLTPELFHDGVPGLSRAEILAAA